MIKYKYFLHESESKGISISSICRFAYGCKDCDMDNRRCFRVCMLFALFFIIIYLNPGISFADTPAFPEQEIRDDDGDWVNIKTRQPAINEFGVPDITSVNYFSDGKFLNATLWLSKPFKQQPATSFKEVDYGMFIDSDFNSKTGFGGIDYKVEIGWKNNTKMWTKTIERWGQYDTNRKVVQPESTYTNFYQKDESYVSVSSNLDQILNPSRFKVIFYSDSRKANGDLIIDYSRWVAIPPLQLVSSTSDGSIQLTQGETKNIILKLNSTEGYEPVVNLKAKTIDDNLKPTFESTNTDSISNFTVPSDGMGITRLTLHANDNAPIGPSILSISANSTFPPEQLLKVNGINTAPYNVISKSSVSVLVDKAPDLPTIIGNLWSKIGDFMTFVYGIIVGISPFIYTRIREHFSKRDTINKEPL